MQRGGAPCLENEPTPRFYCGNGAVDSAQGMRAVQILSVHLTHHNTQKGEECDVGKDGDDSCCDMTTCRFRVSDTPCFENARDPLKRIAGVCNTWGTCRPTCGNGIVDKNEECDPKDVRGGACCDRQTCKFQPTGHSCGSDRAQCDSDGTCKSKVLGTIPAVAVKIDSVDRLRSYRVSMAGASLLADSNNAAIIYYTIDGSSPFPNSTRAFKFDGSAFTLGIEDVEQAAEKFNATSRGSSSPFAANDSGIIAVQLRAKAFHALYISSPSTDRTLLFSVHEMDTAGAGAETTAGIIIGSFFGTVLFGLVALYVIYRTRDAETQKKWLGKVHRTKLKATTLLASIRVPSMEPRTSSTEEPWKPLDVSPKAVQRTGTLRESTQSSHSLPLALDVRESMDVTEGHIDSTSLANDTLESTKRAESTSTVVTVPGINGHGQLYRPFSVAIDESLLESNVPLPSAITTGANFNRLGMQSPITNNDVDMGDFSAIGQNRRASSAGLPVSPLRKRRISIAHSSDKDQVNREDMADFYLNRISCAHPCVPH